VTGYVTAPIVEPREINYDVGELISALDRMNIPHSLSTEAVLALSKLRHDIGYRPLLDPNAEGKG
jgi:hypothetical protein